MGKKVSEVREKINILIEIIIIHLNENISTMERKFDGRWKKNV